MNSVPRTHKALILTSVDQPLSVKSVSTPALLPGSAIVRVLSTLTLSYASNLYSGALQYPLHPPQTIGGGAIGRVVAIGSDATSLQPGQLVLVDAMVRGREDPTNNILMGTHGGISEGAAKLMGEGAWRDGSYAEFARWPLENVHVLDEAKLLQGGLGYSVSELAYMLRLLVPMGGIAELDVRSGDRVVIAPATGQFGGAAVEVALAMGADVVVCGRKGDVLEKLKSTLEPVYPHAKIDVVQLTGTVDTDTAAIKACGTIDKYIDFSPAAAAGSTHIQSCLMALKQHGKACFMGGITGTVEIPYLLVMFNNLHICGNFMYQRDAIKKLISLVETGRLKYSLPEMKAFGLDEWQEAFKEAEERSAWREIVVLEPGRK